MQPSEDGVGACQGGSNRRNVFELRGQKLKVAIVLLPVSSFIHSLSINCPKPRRGAGDPMVPEILSFRASRLVTEKDVHRCGI